MWCGPAQLRSQQLLTNISKSATRWTIIGGQGDEGGIGGSGWDRVEMLKVGEGCKILVRIYLLRLCPQRLLVHRAVTHRRELGRRGDETRKQRNAIKKHSERCEKEIAN
jgi:hypothetical protein